MFKKIIYTILIFSGTAWTAGILHEIGHLFTNLGNGKIGFYYFLPSYSTLDNWSYPLLNIGGWFALIFLIPLYIYFIKKKSISQYGIALLIAYHGLRGFEEYLFLPFSTAFFDIINFSNKTLIHLFLWLSIWGIILIIVKYINKLKK